MYVESPHIHLSLASYLCVLKRAQDITEIKRGFSTPVLERTGLKAEGAGRRADDAQLYVSVVSEARSLDMQLASVQEADALVSPGSTRQPALPPPLRNPNSKPNSNSDANATPTITRNVVFAHCWPSRLRGYSGHTARRRAAKKRTRTPRNNAWPSRGTSFEQQAHIH